MLALALSPGIESDYSGLDIPQSDDPDFYFCYPSEVYDAPPRYSRYGIVYVVHKLSDVLHKGSIHNKEILDAIVERERELYGKVVPPSL